MLVTRIGQGLVLTALVAALVVTPLSSTAVEDGQSLSTSDSGKKDCEGKGFVAPGVAHPAHWSAKMNVKLVGPPTAPGFGTRVRANPSAPAPGDMDGFDGYSRWFYPTTYEAARFGATSPSPDDFPVRVGAQCTRQKAPTSTLRASANLGRKSCSGKHRPTMYAFTHGTVWMYFRHRPKGPVQRLRTLRSTTVASSGVFVNDRKIFGARIEVRSDQGGENWLDYYYLRCNKPKREDPYLN